MSTITVRRKHTMDHTAACARLAELAQQVSTRYGVRCAVDGGKATVKGRGVKGHAEVTPDELRLDLQLGLLLRPLRGTIESRIGKAIEQHFGS